MNKPAGYFLIPLFMLTIHGCVYYPRTVEIYDEDCEITVRKEELRGEQVAAISNCVNEACVMQLGIFSVVSAASVIISGSIVVVKNVAYWLERRGTCSGIESKTTGEVGIRAMEPYPHLAG